MCGYALPAVRRSPVTATATAALVSNYGPHISTFRGCSHERTHRTHRLYQGSLPAERDLELAANRAACLHDNHVMDDDGNEHGMGFYWLCADCGFKGWYE